MRVGLGIPYWGADPTREAACVEVQERLGFFYLPWTKFVLGDGKTKHRGAARNFLVRELSSEVDVIVLLDADSYPEKNALLAAVDHAYNHDVVCFPHSQVWSLGCNRLPINQYGPSAGGCWVFRPRVWEYLGGMEERGGWSVDDRTFLEVMKTFGAGPVYHPGILTCLWHRTEARVVPPEDRQIISEYLELSGKPLEMREYLNAHR